MAIRTNNIERFTILPTGYTGINTSNPSKLFTAVGNNMADNAEILVQQSTGTNLGAYISLDNRANSGQYWSIGSTGTLNTPTVAGTLEFYQLGVGTRMLIDVQGRLGLGLGNGILPTANLHSNGSVRFQNLPSGSGNIVVIDANGNLFRSNATANRVSFDASDKIEIESLKKDIENLKVELASIKQLLITIVPENKCNKYAYLLGNYPNPFRSSTVISYYLPENSNTAIIKIIALNGRLIQVIPLAKKGTNQITFTNPKSISQDYIYSLEVDGQLIDSKKMIQIK